MREVFTNQDHARVGFYKSVLDEAGIPNFVRNENTNNLLTQIPSPLFFPALCVVHDDDYDTAIQILSEIHYASPEQKPDWRCLECGEEVPGNFDSCWQCGALHADGPSSANEAGDAE